MTESFDEPLPTPYTDWLAATFAEIQRAIADAEPVRSAHEGAPAALAQRLATWVDGAAAGLIDLSHDIHAHPELIFAEHHAVKAISATLAGWGVDAHVGVGGLDTALRAEVGTGGRPRVAICAEYDALPGIGHACGHNVIAATAVGAFGALAALADDLPGSVTLVGCPAEEGGGGKEHLARAGVFDDVDAAIMLHPFGVDAIAHEWLGVRTVDVTYRGLSAHAAAMPFMGRNALDSIVDAYTGLARLRQHILPGDRVHGIITEGGQKPNIVCDHAAGSFFLRSRSVEGLAVLTDRARDVFEAAALSNGTRVRIDWDMVPLYLPLRNNLTLAARYSERMAQLERVVAPQGVLPAEMAASTDMGNISQRVPSIHPLLAIAPPTVPIHNPEFATWAAGERADRGVVEGADALAHTALDFLVDEALREAVHAEFLGAGGPVDVEALSAPPD